MAVNAEITFISHPKAGRTWIRYMLLRANALIPGKMLFPGFHFDHNWKRSAKHVVYMIRDPRDIAASYYFYKKGGKGKNPEINEWIKGRFPGILNHFKEAYENIKQRGTQNLVVKYENFHKDTFGELYSLVEWGYKATGKKFPGDSLNPYLKGAVEFSSFENMKKKEEEGGWYLLASRRGNDVSTYKVRRGVAGGYTDYLCADTIEWCKQEMANGEYASVFSKEYLGKNYKPVLDITKDFPHPPPAKRKGKPPFVKYHRRL